MSSEGPAPEKARGWGVVGLIALVLVAGLIGFGVIAWKRRPSSKFSPAADLSISEYLSMKAGKQIREVWLDGNEIYAELASDLVLDGRSFHFIHLVVPPAYLANLRGVQELQSGLDPSRFTVLRQWP